MPREHLRIEQIPVVPVADPHADAPPRLQEPLGRQHLDRFANGGAAHPELNREIVLPRQQVVGSAMFRRESIVRWRPRRTRGSCPRSVLAASPMTPNSAATIFPLDPRLARTVAAAMALPVHDGAVVENGIAVWITSGGRDVSRIPSFTSMPSPGRGRHLPEARPPCGSDPARHRNTRARRRPFPPE